MHPICPLWAPIHQAKREVPKRRDNLLLKCLKGEGIVGARRRFFAMVLNFRLGQWSQCCYGMYVRLHIRVHILSWPANLYTITLFFQLKNIHRF